MSNNKLLAVVIPVFNEEDNIQTAYEEVTSVFNKICNKYDLEIIFTDNHSSDNTYSILSNICYEDSNVKVIRFSKNIGYQNSILMGYKSSKADAIIQLDCDLQDPPELIFNFIEEWENGADVVYGIRSEREENWFINNIRKLFYRLINILSEDNLPQDAGDFRLIDRKIIDILVKIKDPQPYLRGLIASIGFNQVGITYKRQARKKGNSKFNVIQLFSLAIDGIISHSVIPLRLASIFGIVVALMTTLLSIIYLISKLVYGAMWPAGFTTTTILILISISLNALFLGVIGEYIARIYRQTKQNSLVAIEKCINC
jgi:polyisoprenyl-phosphate glycosyltransferase